MQSSDIPTKFRVPFANAADSGHKTVPVPYTTTAPGRASLQQGFPPSTFIPVASGGNPPWGADANGLMNQATAWLRWMAAGGAIPVYDGTFASQIGGYPKGAMLQASPFDIGRFWVSLTDNNTSNPDSGGANWLAFPDLPILLQQPNYGVATGAVNSMKVTLFPAPTSFAQIVGAPIRVKINHTNTITTPTLQINGLAAATCINADGSAIRVGQLPLNSIMEGIPRDDGKFQVNSPSPPVVIPPSGSPVITGLIYLCPTETVPVWGLECNGSAKLIADYPALFAEIGTRYGGNGTTNFRVPDYRGYFLRGWDHGVGRDLGPRTANPGGISGDHVGSLEVDTAGNIVFANVLASLNNPGGGGPNADPLWNEVDASEGTTAPGFRKSLQFVDNINHTAKISLNTNVGSGETRPLNTSIMFVIAF